MEAVARARRGEGPTLIECETYRFRGHSLADPDELRSKEEKAAYAARDPIPQLKKYMIDNGLATEADIAEIERKVRGGGEGVWGRVLIGAPTWCHGLVPYGLPTPWHGP